MTRSHLAHLLARPATTDEPDFHAVKRPPRRHNALVLIEHAHRHREQDSSSRLRDEEIHVGSTTGRGRHFEDFERLSALTARACAHSRFHCRISRARSAKLATPAPARRSCLRAADDRRFIDLRASIPCRRRDPAGPPRDLRRGQQDLEARHEADGYEADRTTTPMPAASTPIMGSTIRQ